jgi:hypothetical protein
VNSGEWKVESGKWKVESYEMKFSEAEPGGKIISDLASLNFAMSHLILLHGKFHTADLVVFGRGSAKHRFDIFFNV